MEKVRVIQVGAGGFGKSWMEVVMNYDHTELVAIVDVMPENLSQAQAITGLPEEALFMNPSEAFQKVQADMVLIVTPPQTHKKIAMEAVTAGFHVMMEKPLTHTYEEAVELVEFTQRYTKHVMISQNYRWRAPIQTVKKLLQKEIIGKIGYIEYEFRKAMKFGGWRDEYKEILLEDMSIHHFDIMRYLLEKEPEEIYAQSYRPAWSWFSGNPTAGVMVRFQNDIRVNYFGSWVSRGKETTWNGDIRVVGEKGAIELIDEQVHVHLVNETEEVEYRAEELVEMPFGDRASSLDDMVKSIREKRKPSTTIEDNIRSFELTCMAIESAVTGKKILMQEFSRIPLVVKG
jgi:predicted dehydrogenase